jgi:opacity protein-like surface antigen
MRLKLYVGLALALLFVGAAYFAHAQTVPAAIGPRAFSPFAIGAGFSGYNNPDFGHGHILGGTLWIDYTPSQVPHFLRGIGVEAEARDLNYGRTATLPSNLREDVAGAGLIYSWPYFRRFSPYGKFLMGLGNADYMVPTTTGGYKPYNQGRTVTMMGGGLEYRAFKSVWVRGDYEYQYWPDFFKHTNPAIPAGLLNPQGITVGAMYHF